MGKLTLYNDLTKRLNGLTQPVEVCDADGTTLGHFLPGDLFRKLMYAAAEAACPYSPEQLEQFENEAGGGTLAEFWHELTQS
jgi:hypothetical protein